MEMPTYHSPMARKTLTRSEEIDRFVALYGEEGTSKMMEAMERQFLILHNRSQVALGLAGIVITTTGFSGRIIAGTSALAQGLIVAGVGLAMVSALLVVLGVLHLRWLTQQPGELIRPWLETCLAYRDKKTNYYRAGIILLLVGIALYVAAIAVMLMNPTIHTLPMTR